MSVRFYADEFRCAIYEEAPGGGDPVDPASLMNRPVLNPTAWLANIYFHSDLNYYRIAAQDLNRVISHAAVPAKTTPAGNGADDTSDSVVYYGQGIEANHLLIQHNLGYVPKFFCLHDGKILPHGIPIQNQGSGRVRFVTAYATTSQIRLHEVGWSADVALSAVSRTYQIIVFHEPTVDPSLPMLDVNPGNAVFGQGKFQGGEPHLRADGLGDIVWPIANRKSAAIGNGGLRAYYPDGTYVDFLYFSGTLAAPTFFNTSSGI